MEPKVKLLWATPDPEFQVIRSARICYNSEDKIDSRWEPTENAQSVAMGGGMRLDAPMVRVSIGKDDEKLLRKLMTNQHNATLRFAEAAFQISGISRICSHQMVRLAHCGILQRSQRYCNEGETEFYFPESFKYKYDIDVSYMDEAKHIADLSIKLYKKMVEDGVKEEDARYVLPGAVSTQLNMTANFQTWKHFLGIRLSKKVQYETRLVASLICKELYGLAPIIFEGDYEKLDKIGL